MQRLSACAAALLLAGCASMAPPYERPAVALPAQYDAPAASPSGDAGAQAAAVQWRSYFADPALQRLITQALERNHDLRTAMLRVQEAQASYGIQRSARYPTLGLSGEAARARTPAGLSPSGQAVTGSQFQAGLGISSWEIDFWGRIASLDEAALHSFLATDAARRTATVALVAQVADSYLALRELDERLRLAQDSAASQRESLRIFTRRHEVGSASRLELTQVQTLLAQAESLLTQLQQQRAAQAHALELLVGGPAELPPVPAPAQAEAAWQLPALAAGLPSELLLQRPDLAAAEHRLRAAQAQIGAARAAFFPSIQLTAFGGLASSELDQLFQGNARSWSFAPRLTLPIFDAGRNQANLDLAEVRRELAVVQYEQAVQTAFREVADALSARRWLGEQLQVQRAALAVQQDRARLSHLAYDHGASSFLDVLDAERSLISAAQQLAQTRRALLASQVALYRALGGGAQHLPDAPTLTRAAQPQPSTPSTPR
jgi:multidrug efflux system outer membrane protein